MRMACCSHAGRGRRICLLQETLLRPRRRLVIATSVEMTGANYGKCERCERIEWAEADGAPCPFDCDLGLAQTNVDPTAQEPSHGQIRIEDESAVDKGRSILGLVHHECAGEPAHGECDRVVFA